MSADLDSLRPYYHIEEHNKHYYIYCKGCKQAWCLPVGEIKIGSVLKLLDHAHSHDTRKGDK